MYAPIEVGVLPSEGVVLGSTLGVEGHPHQQSAHHHAGQQPLDGFHTPAHDVNLTKSKLHRLCKQVDT